MGPKGFFSPRPAFEMGQEISGKLMAIWESLYREAAVFKPEQ